DVAQAAATGPARRSLHDALPSLVRRRARELCPPWDLFAGCIDQQIMQGRGRIGDATLVCKETAWKVHQVVAPDVPLREFATQLQDRKSTRLNSSHVKTSYAVFCL